MSDGTFRENWRAGGLLNLSTTQKIWVGAFVILFVYAVVKTITVITEAIKATDSLVNSPEQMSETDCMDAAVEAGEKARENKSWYQRGGKAYNDAYELALASCQG